MDIRTVIGLLRRAKPPLSNITPEEGLALRELKKDTILSILPADKVRATVVMDRSTYEEQLGVLLSDRSSYIIAKDHCISLQRKMNAKLLELNVLSTTDYNKMRCSSGRTPSIYGLPKIHKPGIPLRPIVSFYSSPTYNLSKYFSPLIGSTPSEVRNSKDFVTFVQSLCLDSNEVMMSFDVISLFLPVDLALRVACQHLESDNTLGPNTSGY